MSHEIRTPMNGIIGLTEVLLDTSLDAEQREYLTLVQSSAESLLTIINDILDVSKIEAGKLSLERREFDLRAVVLDMLKGLNVTARAKGLSLACDVATDVPALLRGDPGRLRQILVNLVGNAIKFTDRGEVSVAVERWPETPDALHSSVRDYGRTDLGGERRGPWQHIPLHGSDGAGRHRVGQIRWACRPVSRFLYPEGRWSFFWA